MPKPNIETNTENDIEGIVEIVVESPDYATGEHQLTATITKIIPYERAEDKFKEHTSQNQIGKPIYELLFIVNEEVPTGLPSGGSCIISKNNGKSKKSHLYKYFARYKNYPKLGDIVKVENSEEGYWDLIL